MTDLTVEGLTAGFELGALVLLGKEQGPGVLGRAVAGMDEATTSKLLVLALGVLCDDRLDEVWAEWGDGGPREMVP